MSDANDSVRVSRIKVFSEHWPFDEEIRETASTLPSHRFLAKPSGQYSYVYLTRFVKALSEKHFDCPFSDVAVLDWGCGKGHVSKMIVIWAQNNSIVATFSRRGDTCFGQEVPFIEGFNIHVKPLEHESI